jgi:tetratricopeptide (TPR) repeat protein
MMRFLNMKVVSSFFTLLFFTGCTIHQELVKTAAAQTTGGEINIDWYGADVSLLPIANNSSALTQVAHELCTRQAPFGQKIYAMRLATMAVAADRKNKSASVELARTAFFVADAIDKDENKIKKCAEIGVIAAREAGIKADNPEACFFFALNQGIIVRFKGLFAINKLPEIHEALKISQKADTIDDGGPLRVLGMLYLKAPAWPSGIGDLDKALELLEQSVKKYPQHPQNYMFYAEALIEDDNKEKALQNLDIAYKLAVPEMWGIYYSAKWRTEIEELKKKIAD